MCSDPDAVGGGVSTEKTPSRPTRCAAARSKRYVPSDSQRSPHFASSPSSLGLSGMSGMRGELLSDMGGTVCTYQMWWLRPTLPVRVRAGGCVCGRGAITCNQMVVEHELSDAEVDRIFRALADGT